MHFYIFLGDNVHENMMIFQILYWDVDQEWNRNVSFAKQQSQLERIAQSCGEFVSNYDHVFFR